MPARSLPHLSNYPGPLDQREVQGLLTALNGEYRASALCGEAIKDLGQVQAFLLVQEAEATQTSTLLGLFRKYEVPIPDNPWSSQIPQLSGLDEACQAGVDQEQALDAVYEEVTPTTKRTDIITVYESLQAAALEGNLAVFNTCAR